MKKKPIDEARKKLTDKLAEVKKTTTFLQDVIYKISSEAISNAELVLKETSKSKFLNKYSKASQELESCLNKFLLVSDAFDSVTEEGDDEEDSEDSEDESDTKVSAHFMQQSRNTKKLNSDITVNDFEWKHGVAYSVLITNLCSPWEFYVQNISTSNDIMEQLCLEFMDESANGYNGGVDEIPSVGMFCCARYSDNSWYRAKIVKVLNTDCGHSSAVEVFFVDEGFFFEVSLQNIRPLSNKFASLPAQAVHCVLGGVQPLQAFEENKCLSFSKCSKLWDSKSHEWLKKKMQEGTFFLAYFQQPPEAAYTAPCQVDRSVLVCDLYLHSLLKNSNNLRPPIEDNISFLMVTQELAGYCPFFGSEICKKSSQNVLKQFFEKESAKQPKLSSPENNKRNNSIKIKREIPEFQTNNIPPVKEEDTLPECHIKSCNENETKDDSELDFQYSFAFNEQSLEGNLDTFFKVLVSEVLDPSLFYVHLVSPEAVKLDDLMEGLNSLYKDKYDDIRKHSKNMELTEGMAVAAKSPTDHNWYRSIIVSTTYPCKNEELFNVLYVDFGSTEMVPREFVLPICREFCSLPMETIPCALADVETLTASPIRDVQHLTPEITDWSSISIAAMKSFVSNQPLMMALKSRDRNKNGLYEVYLYDTNNGKDLFINQMFIDRGLAVSRVFSKAKRPSIAPTLRIEESQLEEDATDFEMDGISCDESTWDPMKEQFLSYRNTYSVDVNDPGVAALGIVESKKNVCRQYSRGRCYRGNECMFLHEKPGEEQVEVFCDDSIIKVPDVGEWIPVIVTAQINPTHFWVNFPLGNKFDVDTRNKGSYDTCPLYILTEEMNKYYSFAKRNDKTDLLLFGRGELIAAPFEGSWYRARVLNYLNDSFRVYYVDYGNTGTVKVESARRLIPDFLHLPLQAVECYLHGIRVEEQITQKELNELRKKFDDLVGGKLLIAHISSVWRELVIDLYDTFTNPHLHVNNSVAKWKGIVRSKQTKKKPKDTKKMIMLPG